MKDFLIESTFFILETFDNSLKTEKRKKNKFTNTKKLLLRRDIEKE